MAIRAYLVEDYPNIRESLAETLSEVAHVTVVGQADNEAEATAWLTQNPDGWDLVIVDIFLRDGNGVGVVSSCKNRRRNQKLVVLTGYGTPEIRRLCSDLGVDVVFDKSIDTDALIDYCKTLG
ncbi:MAG TPA: response regulator [Burkholderiaceae bacterium]|nr:response regulator [Burkholderiaceae bacterium]